MANSLGLLDFDWDVPLTDEKRDQMLTAIVQAVRKWRLEVPALLFLESNAPLGRIAGQGLVAFSPFIAPALPSGIGGVQQMHKLLDDPKNTQRLIDLLSETQTEKQTPPESTQKGPHAARE